MAAFDLAASEARARRRLGDRSTGPGPSAARMRSDAGTLRLDPGVVDCMRAVLGGYDRPRMKVLMRDLTVMCRARALDPPSRATVYKIMALLPGPSYSFDGLPAAVRAALYNLGPGGDVPGHQVAFYCFNYGDPSAMCFAAGLPWISLHQALRMPGWRLMSRGPLEAVAVTRGIVDGRA